MNHQLLTGTIGMVDFHWLCAYFFGPTSLVAHANDARRLTLWRKRHIGPEGTKRFLEAVHGAQGDDFCSPRDQIDGP